MAEKLTIEKNSYSVWFNRNKSFIRAQILNVPDEVRGGGVLKKGPIFNAHDQCCIKSIGGPQLGRYVLFLRGTYSSSDNVIVSRTYESEKNAIFIETSFIMLLMQLNLETRQNAGILIGNAGILKGEDDKVDKTAILFCFNASNPLEVGVKVFNLSEKIKNKLIKQKDDTDISIGTIKYNGTTRYVSANKCCTGGTPNLLRLGWSESDDPKTIQGKISFESQKEMFASLMCFARIISKTNRGKTQINNCITTI